MAARALLSSRLAGLYGPKVVDCGRRTYSAAAAAVARKEPVDVAGNARPPGAADKAAKAKEEESFWMRDPNTGCWMPENHMHDVDAADLRARLLCLTASPRKIS
ncbi:hypothetical protein BAE44_0019357 [Dichanthelium oligosanthes]|uniref:Late embryogenesis abundant protein Lea5 n=1 Tax=Dichanthelium oligosanthes TaxID=888268 RepID=A0A1E5V3P5_9POAL|nr:hypothetical protein BAE44_0019357 [Dichanthelium oligosanthes]